MHSIFNVPIVRIVTLYILVYKKAIELCLWSALRRSLLNLKKSFFHNRKDLAFSFRLSSFFFNLKEIRTNTDQMKITGRNRIFSPPNAINH